MFEFIAYFIISREIMELGVSGHVSNQSRQKFSQDKYCE